MIGWSAEQIIHRNQQLQRYATSRLDIKMSNIKNWRKELHDKVHSLRYNGLAKRDKEFLLRRIRQLEKLLRVDLGNYNSTDFAKDWGDKENT